MYSFQFLTSSEPTVVLYGAEWCPACQIVKNKLEGTDYVYVDIDLYPDLAKQEGIEVVPQVYWYKDGTKKFVAGYATRPDLILERLEKLKD